MNKKMRELQDKIQQKANEAQSYLDGENKDLAKAEALLNEVDELKKELALEERAAEAAKAAVPTKAEGTPAGEPAKVDSTKAFADAVRSRFKDLNEGAGADGGYTVPEDIQTRINTYKEERFSLASLIDHETVSTLSGRRTYKKRAQHTGFTQVAENGKITKVAAPQFEVLNYSIKKYAGYMPVTNELLEDSDAAIANLMIEWLGEEDIATENAQILAKIKEKETTALTGIKDIKKAINVTLAAFAGSVSITTNSDGLQYLDTLEDKNGRPLLSPDPVKPMEMFLSVGVRRIPVVVIPNEVMPSAEGKVPFIMGDLREYLKQFDRKSISLMQSNVAAVGDLNAYEQDLTLIRGIIRKDWQIKDAEAIVLGELTVTA